ncbi:GNAT family N-acetyltransferase [Amycolatopsis granulosa]|uniref:GNAT family N-acetyltransferase n=1 Tax=Amycolatopsis granulosa TaxID=185684 RepID=UPI0014220C84|nr:GNAT superfamily N-acetyltransferase [Amycolatopsis granulosa]
MSEFTVRPAWPAEYPAVGALTAAAYVADGLIGQDDDYARELADAARRAEHAELLVAADANGLLGSVTIVQPGSRYSEIAREGELEFRMLATAPAARGRGVGEALVRAVLDRARTTGAEAVVLCSLDAMRTAHRLYTRLGFTRIPQRDWEPRPGLWLRAFRLVC